MGEGYLSLNIGCGSNKLPQEQGWVNIDLGEADLNVDVRQGLPFADGEVYWIVTEHFIEHLEFSEARDFLIECRRVLRPAGAVRVLTPDLNLLVHDYFYCTWKDRLWVQKYCPDVFHSGCHMLNASFNEWGHKYLYDEWELKYLFKLAGFAEPYRCTFNKSIHDMLDKIDNRDDSLIIEAVK